MLNQQNLFDQLQRKEFMQRLKDGDKGNCPCCQRYAQVYKRRIYDSIARQLIRLYTLGGDKDYVNAVHLILKGSHSTQDFQKAKYFDLIERRPLSEDDLGKTSGWWRLTERGVQFVQGKLAIPHIALVFDDNVLGFEGNPVTIKDCLDEHFSYERLMSA